MCTHKKEYLAAQLEITRCKKAIKYYETWKSKINDCKSVVDKMQSQTANIATLCKDLIINGKPIDEGENHYSNGGAATYSKKLEKISDALETINKYIDKVIKELNKSKDKADDVPKPPVPGCADCNPTADSAEAPTPTKTKNTSKATRGGTLSGGKAFNSAVEQSLK